MNGGRWSSHEHTTRRLSHCLLENPIKMILQIHEKTRIRPHIGLTTATRCASIFFYQNYLQRQAHYHTSSSKSRKMRKIEENDDAGLVLWASFS